MLRKVTKISMLFVLSLVISATNLLAGDFSQFNQFWSATNYFSDTLDVGESKTKTIYANEPHNYTNIKLLAGKKYKFTVASPEWNNGFRETTAAGYYSNSDNTRRHLDYKMMALVGEIFNSNNDPLTWTGKKFLIGAGRDSYTAAATGYLIAFANDCLPCYVDNSRVVTLTVKRIE